jgi:hypothetical protein
VNVLSGQLLINEAVVFTELDEEAVLLNVETGVYFGLDPVGTEIWRMLADGVSEDTLFERLLIEYDVEPVQLRSDLAAFLDLLKTNGLVRLADQ